MFYNCESLNILDLSFLETKNVKNMRNMFYNCKNNKIYLTFYEPNNFETDNIFGSYMTIIYNIGKYDNEVQLFNQTFVVNNKNNCYLLIEGIKFSLCSKLIFNKNEKEKKLIEIKLIEIRTITNMRAMFDGCSSLNNLADISNWNTKNVTDMSYMFYECSSLNNLPDISNWNTENVTNMSCMFDGCSKKIIPEKFKKYS